MNFALALIALMSLVVALVAVASTRRSFRIGALLFSGTIRKYDVSVTPQLPINTAITAGVLYGLSGGYAAQATNAAGAYIPAIGFAVTSMTAADATSKKEVALATKGIIDLTAGQIQGGALTAGAPVYLHTGGTYTSTRPTTNGTYLQCVGIALTTTRVLVHINPSGLLVQTSGNSVIGGV